MAIGPWEGYGLGGLGGLLFGPEAAGLGASAGSTYGAFNAGAGEIGRQGGMRGVINNFADSGLGKFLDPQGFMKQYNPWSTEEDKYGQKPMSWEEMQAQGLTSGQQPMDPRYAELMQQYQREIAANQNVGSGDPAMMEAMRRAGGAASQQAKLRGLAGPNSVGMSQSAMYNAGLGYQQQENARRAALRSQLLSQQGGLTQGMNELQERQRQFNTGLQYDRYKAAMDAYNQRVAGHNSPLSFIPFVGQAMNASATSRRGGY